MWEAVLVLFIAGLAVSRFASMINELISSVLPTISNMGISAERLVTWIVAAGFSVVAVLAIEYDPLAAIGIAAGGADDIWNILLMFAMVDAADSLYRGRIVRR
jgi:hypothetical protein